MPSYKLTYFDARGRGEFTRLLFAVGEIPFDDKRIAFKDWPTLKPETVLGFLPELTVNGRAFPQSLPIARYVASKLGLTGKNELERLKADIVIETCNDFKKELFAIIPEKDEVKKDALKKTFFEVTTPKTFAILEGWLTSYGEDSGYFLPSGFSWADVGVFDALWMSGGEQVLDKYPKLAAHFNRIENQPQIKKWLLKRPKTEF